MPTRGYEFSYLRVFISMRTSEISSWTRENKMHIHKRACNILFIIKIYWERFWWFSEYFRPLSEDFPKLFRRLDESFRTCAEDFRGGTDVASIIQQHIGVLFKRWLGTTTSYFHVWRYHVSERKLTWYFLGPVPERRNTSIPGINVPYFRDNFIPGINSVPERKNSAIQGINQG